MGVRPLRGIVPSAGFVALWKYSVSIGPSGQAVWAQPNTPEFPREDVPCLNLTFYQGKLPIRRPLLPRHHTATGFNPGRWAEGYVRDAPGRSKRRYPQYAGGGYH